MKTSFDIKKIESFREELELLWYAGQAAINAFEEAEAGKLEGPALEVFQKDVDEKLAAYKQKSRDYIEYIRFKTVDPVKAPGVTVVENPSTGLPIYGFENTTQEAFDADKAYRAEAGKILAAMPVSLRMSFLKVMKAVEEKFIEAYINSMTIDNGKPYWQAHGEMVKALSWYDTVLSHFFAKEVSTIRITDAKTGAEITNPNQIRDGREYYFTDLNYQALEDGINDTSSSNYTKALAQAELVEGPAVGATVRLKPPSDAPSWSAVQLEAISEALRIFQFMVRHTQGSAAATMHRETGIDIRANEVIDTLRKGILTVLLGRDVSYFAEADYSVVVGSTQAGKANAEERVAAGKDSLRTVNELSGINPHILLKDGNVTKYVKDGHTGVVSGSGLRCTRPDPWLVDAEIWGDAKERAVKAFTTGHAGHVNPHAKYERNADGTIKLDVETSHPIKVNGSGALMKKSFHDDFMAAKAKAIELGFEVHGGELLKVFGNKDYHVSDMIIISDNPTPEQIAFATGAEVFGPVARMFKCNGVEQMIDICKTSESALSGGCYTNDIAEFTKVRKGVGSATFHHNMAAKDKAGEGQGIHAQQGGEGKGIRGSTHALRAMRNEDFAPTQTSIREAGAAKAYMQQLIDEGRFIPSKAERAVA